MENYDICNSNLRFEKSNSIVEVIFGSWFEIHHNPWNMEGNTKEKTTDALNVNVCMWLGHVIHITVHWTVACTKFPREIFLSTPHY